MRTIQTPEYPRLQEIWESAVTNTHDFLQKEDFEYYQERLTQYFEHVALTGFEQNGQIVGFMGVAEGNLEMLFIHHDYRNMGIGKKLLTHAVAHLNVTKVDVNEQNIQAVGFYKHLGFRITDRSETDAEGKTYPVLHMQL